MKVQRCEPADLDELAALRAALWPDLALEDARTEALAFFGAPDRISVLCRSKAGEAVGFAEATLRRDYVNGCDTSPVSFLEGIYVEPGHRRAGVGVALCAAIEAWARGLGCSELGSDALLDNGESHAFHAALGFEARERVVCYRKLL